ncbi:LytR/AlgR family response regulator transcription factor [Sciscionella sediminilitoris]|uniref:LytR/AlgR family response regulator transcription factor n=1 Tax=Sciscionella sediminilitoris TaxID=1445613 RepID=UPI0004DF9CC4|nr:LytTR family DNA-binding domain-containing protein [Sciscionella sp. SE31]
MLVLAVDDEQHGLDELRFLLSQHPRVRRVLLAGEAAEALRLISGGDEEVAARRDAKQTAVDAVFVDIDMPGLSGTELARVLAALKPGPPAIVFVTGFGQEAVTAFELGAVDYVLKPLKAERLAKAVDRVWADRMHVAGPQPGVPGAPQVEAEDSNDEVIPVELAGTTKLISRSSVRWVEAQGDYARLHTTEGSHLVRIPLAQLEERWAEAGFVRIHRSYLVAQGLITELRMGTSGYTVVLGDGEQELPVSRRHTRDLKDRIVRSPKNGWGS